MRTQALIVVALAAAPGSAAAQKAVAAAEQRIDVDGDGQLDVIRVEDPPALQVLITGPKAPTAFRPFAAAGRISGATISAARGKDGAMMIVGTIELDGARREAMAVRWRNKGLEPVWNGPVGPQEPDGDWSYEVAATDQGLLRWQGRPGVVRCDDKPAWLFLELWDPAAQRFRRVKQTPVRVDDKAPVLRAARGAPPPASDASPPLVFRRALVSAQAGAAGADELLPSRELTDGDPRTAWREDQADFGRGEVISLQSGGAAVPVRAVRIIPGDASTPAAMAAANRLKRAALLVGKRAYWIDFPTDPAQPAAAAAQPFWVTLDPPVEAACVALVIDQVWSGGSGNTAIAELAVLTDLEMTPGGGLAELAVQVGKGGHAGEQAARALAAVGAPAAPALIAEADKPGQSAATLLRLRRALVPLNAPAAVDQLLLGLRAGGDGAVMTELQDGLSAIGGPAVPALRALIAEPRAPLEARTRAVAALHGMSSAVALPALFTLVGVEPIAVRKSVGLGLAVPRPPFDRKQYHLDLLAALAAAQQRNDPAAEATLWIAIGTAAFSGTTPEEDQLRAALTARLASATGYELRDRLLDAATVSSDPAVLAALAQMLGTLAGTDSHAIALRRVAARKLYRNRTATGTTMLVPMLADPDPGVRMAAAASLGERPRKGAGDPELARVLAGDRWTDVRIAAAGALGADCRTSPDSGKALLAALDTDKDVKVQTAALGALVSCRVGGLNKLLVRVCGDRGVRYQVRIQAVGFAIGAKDRALVPQLLACFDQARSEMLGSEDPDAPQLAAALAGGLGGLGDERVVDPLMRAAADSAFPEVQAGAVAGLGKMCPRDARDLVRELMESPQESVKRAARGAFARCYR